MWRRLYTRSGKPIAKAKRYASFATLTQWEADTHLTDMRDVSKSIARSVSLKTVRYRGDVSTELTIVRKRYVEVIYTEAIE